MTRNLNTLLLLILSASLLQACFMFRDKPAEYLASEEGKPLQLPEGLDAPRAVSPVLIRIEDMRAPSGDELNPLPPRTANTGGGGDANAYIAWSATGAYLAVKDSPDSVARRLRFAIQRSGMTIVERNDDGAHRFEFQHVRISQEKGFFEKMLFWRSDYGPDYSGTYQVRLEPDDDETRVYLLIASGIAAGTNAAEHILGLFMERLG